MYKLSCLLYRGDNSTLQHTRKTTFKNIEGNRENTSLIHLRNKTCSTATRVFTDLLSNSLKRFFVSFLFLTVKIAYNACLLLCNTIEY